MDAVLLRDARSAWKPCGRAPSLGARPPAARLRPSRNARPLSRRSRSRSRHSRIRATSGKRCAQSAQVFSQPQKKHQEKNNLLLLLVLLLRSAAGVSFLEFFFHVFLIVTRRECKFPAAPDGVRFCLPACLPACVRSSCSCLVRRSARPQDVRRRRPLPGRLPALLTRRQPGPTRRRPNVSGSPHSPPSSRCPQLNFLMRRACRPCGGGRQPREKLDKGK